MSAASDPRLVRRALAAALLAAAAAAGGPSCTAALGLDGRQSAPTALCGKLQDCYANGAPPACETRVSARLSGNPGGDALWLVDFSMDTCLDSCAAARRCLDLSPVCGLQGEACQVREDCCDFVSGEADCQLHRCCRPSGVHCASDSDCCSNAGYCDSGHCGGFVCHDPGKPCHLDQECCTKSCVDHVCAGEICAADGFECAADGDCCSHHCESSGRCGQSCVASGGVCMIGVAQKGCCSGLTCFTPPGADSGVCSAAMCLPDGVSCVAGLKCCSGYCDPNFHECTTGCASMGSPCKVASDCCNGMCTNGTCASHCSDDYCMTATDCCTQMCMHGSCLPTCNAPTCTHDECTEGGPLPGMGQTPCPLLNTTCIDAVCAMDDYCCCGAWDTLCISHVSALQNGPCAGVCL
jgi:hypothetical protein